MQLLTPEIAQTLPQFYSQDGMGGEAIVHLKYVDPISGWTWLVLEFNKHTDEFFGLVKGFEQEYQYFRLKDLASVGRIIRDENFTPCKLKDCANV